MNNGTKFTLLLCAVTLFGVLYFSQLLESKSLSIKRVIGGNVSNKMLTKAYRTSKIRLREISFLHSKLVHAQANVDNLRRYISSVDISMSSLPRQTDDINDTRTKSDKKRKTRHKRCCDVVEDVASIQEQRVINITDFHAHTAYRSAFGDVAGHNFNLTKHRDVWIYSVFYEYATPIRNTSAIHTIALTANEKYKSSEFSCILTFRDGKKKIVPGVKRLMPEAFNYGYINIHMDCALGDEDRPVYVAFFNKDFPTPSQNYKIVYPSGKQRNLTMCYSTLYGWFNKPNQLIQV